MEALSARASQLLIVLIFGGTSFAIGTALWFMFLEPAVTILGHWLMPAPA